MESYEVEIRGQTHPVKAVRSISGHNIKQYQIHGGNSIPFIRNSDQTKMEEGEVFAIETFGTTGRGYLVDGVCPSFGCCIDGNVLTPPARCLWLRQRPIRAQASDLASPLRQVAVQDHQRELRLTGLLPAVPRTTGR